MVRAAGLNMERTFALWKMFTVQGDRSKMKKARTKVAAANMCNALENKRKRHLRAGVRPLAKGVANTKT